IGCQRPSRFWGLGCPKIYHEAEDTLDYYLSFQKAPNAIYRIDTQADDNGDFSQAPNITSITFSDAVLWDDDTQMTVTVGVGDAQGWDNIQSVLLTVLVDGMEDTYWPMGREPLAFPTGDPGSTWLYDDGTHGDQTAGDGVFTFDAIATRKGDRDPNGFNTWYAHYSLPNDVGIRIIAQDKDGNSTIADTRLTIAACDDTGKTYSSNITGRVFACTSQNVRFLTGATVTAGTEMHLKSQTVSFQNDTRVEEGAVLSVSTE
ncbi:choice-of-anchor X domain-containing protein, partial [Thiolapillus sp.]